MADNTVANPGVGGDVCRTIDRGAAKTQVVGLDIGGEQGPELLVAGSVGVPVAVVGPVALDSPVRVQNVGPDDPGYTGPFAVFLSGATQAIPVTPTQPTDPQGNSAPGTAATVPLYGEAGALNAMALGPINCANYRMIAVQVFGTFSLTATISASNDGQNYYQMPASSCYWTTGGFSSSYAASAAQLLMIDTMGFNWVRIQASAYTSGKMQCLAALSAQAVPLIAASSQIVAQATASALQATATQALGSAATRWFAQLSDGSNSPAIKAASTAAAAADPSLVVQVSPNQTAMPVNITQVSSAADSLNNPLPTIVSDGGPGQTGSAKDPTSLLQQLQQIGWTQIQLKLLAQQACGGGFTPIETPFFIGA